MYQAGDYIVYGSTGVCCVESITTPKETPALSGFEQDRQFYVLKPLYQTGTVYTPVEQKRVLMRHVITRAEAESFINMIPTIQAQAYYAQSMQELRVHYETATQTYDCADLIELTMSIYAKKQYVEQQKRKFGQVDEHYLKRAEEMLYGEFAVALDIPVEEVQAYIEEKVAAAEQKPEQPQENATQEL